MMKKLSILALIAGIAISCTGTAYKAAQKSSKAAEIYPDYAGTVVPVNIAPLNFDIMDGAKASVVEISGKSGTMVLKGPQVRFPLRKWKRLLAENAGGEIGVKVYLKDDSGWTACEPFNITVAREEIDSYLTYRLIDPGYSSYGFLTLRQRDISSFKERDLYNNNLIKGRMEGQCINCHSFQNYRTDNFQFHARNTEAGTMVFTGKDGKRLDFKTGDLLSGAVYPSWHPQQNLIAYSVNSTLQLFYSHGVQRAEIFDGASDLVLYDVDTDEVSYIVHDSLRLETFPYWSADGRTLYYAGAYLPDFGADASSEIKLMTDKVRYNIWSIPFNPSDRTFGTPELVFDAVSDSLSAVTPRPSPDGRYLLSGVGDHGNFHIWNEKADIYLTDLQSGETRPLDEINSDRADSFKSWSSDSRWIAFTSRREDGNYSRIYIAYFGEDGKACKPFLLPQKDPMQNRRLFRSYNVPEFTIEKVKWTPKQIEKIVLSEPGKTHQI